MSRPNQDDSYINVTQDNGVVTTSDDKPLTEQYYESTKNSDPQVIIAMTIGHETHVHSNGQLFPNFNSGIWKEHNKWYNMFCVTAEFLHLEVIRCASNYAAYSSIMPMPKAWNNDKLLHWLHTHSIPLHLTQHKLSFVDKQIEKLHTFVLNEKCKEHKTDKEEVQQWSYKNPINWLRFYHTLIEDNVKEALAKDMHVKTRAELDC